MSLMLSALHRNFNKRKKDTCFIIHFLRRYDLLPNMRCSSSQNVAAADSTTFWRESLRSLWSNVNWILSIKARESSFLPEANLWVRISCRNYRRRNHHLSCLHLSVLRVLQRRCTWRRLSQYSYERYKLKILHWKYESKGFPGIDSSRFIFQKCPDCKTPAEKISGCNHMTCQAPFCVTEWCWVCCRRWSLDCQLNHWGLQDPGTEIN